jgi:hypothetical protein
VGGPGLLTKELFRPFLETCLRGLPHAYRQVAAPVGTAVQVCIDTPIGGVWQLVKTADGWVLQLPGAAPVEPAAAVTLSPDTAWQLFTKGLSPTQARQQAQLRVALQLGEAALHLLAIMG